MGLRGPISPKEKRVSLDLQEKITPENSSVGHLLQRSH